MLKKYLWPIQLLSIGLIIVVASSAIAPLAFAKTLVKNVVTNSVARTSPIAAPTDLITEYSISGSALNIVSAGPNNVWFTMPTANKIGNLVVDAAGNATITEYTTPTAISEPYDLVYDGSMNVIWFTEKATGKLGRLDIGAGTITETSVIPTANSMPTGIGLAADGSVWFAESGTNKLGQYIPSTNTFTESVVYSPTTAGVTNAEFHDIVISEDGSKIWVTSPADHKVLQYSVQTGAYSSIALSGAFDPIAGSSRRPYNITTARDDMVWLTDIANNQIGQLFQGTLANVTWYTVPTSASNPTGIAFGDTGGPGTIFFTGNATDIAGSLSVSNNGATSPRQYGLTNGSQPQGITVDSDGNVWIAQGGSNTIAVWKSPYYEFVYLPVIEAN